MAQPQKIKSNCKPPSGDRQLPQNTAQRAGLLTGIPELDEENLHINENVYEEQPLIKRTNNSVIVENRHNAGIVLGRDYHYGPKNDTNVGSIDIAVGRIGNTDNAEPENYYPDGCGTRSTLDELSAIADSARIYLSQKTNVDKMFGFNGAEAKTSNNRSAVGIKADAVRVISRDPAAGINLIVRPDSVGMRAGKNSLGGKTSGPKGGVSLYGTGEEPLDHMVKSKPLAESLAQLANYIQKLEVMVWDFVSYQKAFNRVVAQATDIEAFYASKGLPDPTKPVSNAKTSLDIYCYVEESGKAISKLCEEYKATVLNLTQDKTTGKTKHQNIPKFASKYHKLN
jgi:hypothetical protein